MIIGISGAQGQGKSTLIKGVIAKHPDIFEDVGLQTARNLLTEWDMTLDEVNRYMPLKIKFQEELLSRHYSALDLPNRSDRCYLVERTFADIFAYALLSAGPFNEYSKWLNDYAKRCSDAQNDVFDDVIYLTGRQYTPEEDGVRSTNPHFSSLSDHVIRTYTEKFGGEDNVIFITSASLDSRIFLLSNIFFGQLEAAN